MKSQEELEKIIGTVYVLIRRCDPTDTDLRGGALQAADYIETKHPELAKRVASENGWRGRMSPEMPT